jgi:hypothetical protein
MEAETAIETSCLVKNRTASFKKEHCVNNFVICAYHLKSLLTYLLTPWSRVLLEKSNRFAASQEIPRILWNPKVHYGIHECPQPVSILNQLNQVHNPTSYLVEDPS